VGLKKDHVSLGKGVVGGEDSNVKRKGRRSRVFCESLKKGGGRMGEYYQKNKRRDRV